MHPHPEKAALAVVGLGPGGLAAAIKAASTGKKVVVFTDRNDYIRPQRIKLTLETLSFLTSVLSSNITLSSDVNLIRDCLANGWIMQTKDLERILYRHIENNPNIQIVRVDRTMTSRLVNDGEHDHHIALSDANGNTRDYHFKHLLAADGIKHQTADMVARDCNKSIRYKQTPLQLRHEYHAAIQLELANPSTYIPRTFIDSLKANARFKGLGWKRLDQPKHYIFTNKNGNKFSFVGEVPECIHREADPKLKEEMLRKWAAVGIHQKFGIPESELIFHTSKKHATKDKLRATTFVMDMNVCEQALISLHESPNDGVFAQVGDARRTPNYRLGHGANDAILGGLAFADAIDDNDLSFDDVKFKEAIKKMDDSVESSMSLSLVLLSGREKKEAEDILKAVDTLISHMKNRNIDTSGMHAVQKEMQQGSMLSTLYDVLNTLEPIIQTHQMSIFFKIYRAIRSYIYQEAKISREQLTQSFSDLKQQCRNYSEHTVDVKMLDTADEPAPPPSIIKNSSN
jgi:hypothetical protein